MKLSELKHGQTIVLDDGFPCAETGPVTVLMDKNDDPYFVCSDGKHYLDGQEDENGDLVGVSLFEGTTE